MKVWLSGALMQGAQQERRDATLKRPIQQNKEKPTIEKYGFN
jgi:hypothetical protein